MYGAKPLNQSPSSRSSLEGQWDSSLPPLNLRNRDHVEGCLKQYLLGRSGAPDLERRCTSDSAHHNALDK
jgi:hypothetical protein